jgi:hypothetical protein
MRLVRADRIDVDDARRDDVARPRHGRFGRRAASKGVQIGARDSVLLADAPRLQSPLARIAPNRFHVEVEHLRHLLDRE